MLVALHVHTEYSPCSESPIDEIAKYCLDYGIEAIGITDHNLIDGALKLQQHAPGLQVIVGEEVSTRQGEIIGLFLEKTIPPGMDLRETCLEIKRQGGLVYAPHPFDKFKIHRIHSKDMRRILDLVDVIEVYNAKTSFSTYNLRAKRFAADHGILGAVGSDSHYVKSIGTALNVMDPFDGPDSFLESLSHAEFKTGAGSLLATWWVRARKLAWTR